MAVAAGFDPSSPSHIQGHTENWDDDFEFQQAGDSKADQPPHRRQGRVSASAGTDSRKMSFASSAVFEDWDADEGRRNNNISGPSSQAVLQQHSEEHGDNWDDDFEDARHSPRKGIRLTCWDGELDLEGESEDEGNDFGFADKEDRTVTAKSRRAVLHRLSASNDRAPSPPPMPPANTGSYQSFSRPFPQRSPNSSVFSVPTTAHTHDCSSTAPLRPSSAFALLPPSPPLYKERERRRLRKKSRPKPQGTFELVSLRGSSANASETRLGSSRSPGPSRHWYGNRHSFSDDGDAEQSACELAASCSAAAQFRTETPTDNSSVDDRRAITPSLSTPAVPQTPVKGTALLSRIGSVKKWGVRRKRASTTPSDVVADSQRTDADPQRTPRAKTSRTSFHTNIPSIPNSISSSPSRPTPPLPQLPVPPPTQQHTTAPSVVPSASSTSSISNHWFFRASSAGSPNARFGSRPSSSGAPSKADRIKKIETPTTTVTTRGRSGSVNQSRSRSRVREGLLSMNPSRTDINNDPIMMPASVPATPTKLIKRKKSLGFMHLRKVTGGAVEDHHNHDREDRRAGGGDGAAVTESPRKGKYVGIGLGRAASAGQQGGEGFEEVGQAQQGESRTRRKSFSKLFLDRDKGNESNGSSQGGGGEPDGESKDGSRGFMGSVRRISLVGKHKRTKSGNGALLSISERLNGNKAPPPPVPSSSSTTNLAPKHKLKTSPNLSYSLPPLPINSSQLSLRLPTPSSLTFQQNSRHTSMHDLPSAFSATDMSVRIASASSKQSQFSNSNASSSSNNNNNNNSLRSVSGLPVVDVVGLQKTPVQNRKRSSTTRSRTSEEQQHDGAQLSRWKSTSSKSHSNGNETNTDHHSSVRRTKILLQRTSSNNRNYFHDEPPPSVTEILPQTPSKPPAPLLPPIELHPPSPPRAMTQAPGTFNGLAHVGSSPSSSSSAFVTPPSSPVSKLIISSSSGNKLSVPPSPNTRALMQQSASLGRAATAGAAAAAPDDDNSSAGNGVTVPMRRNSLGDLKIPARISQAQVGLKRDLGMVREFAYSIDQLKDLQRTYDALNFQVQQIIDAHLNNQTSALSTGHSYAAMPNVTPRSRGRSNTNPTWPPQNQTAHELFVSKFNAIHSRYRITWECANLLIELGGSGNAGHEDSDVMSAPPTSSSSAPILSQMTANAHGPITTKRSRERAITLAGGDESKSLPQCLDTSTSLPGTSVDHTSMSASDGPPLSSPPSMSWRASTGRHDLSQRQLVLLREMLNNANAHANVSNDTAHAGAPLPISSEERPPQFSDQRHSNVNRHWRWGDVGNSTVTLPSENTDQFENSGKTPVERKRRSGRLGMIVLRDLLRALKWSTTEAAGGGGGGAAAVPPVPDIPAQSTTSLSTESSTGSRRLWKTRPRQSSQSRGKLPLGSQSVRSTSGTDQNHHKPDERMQSPYVPAFVNKSSPRRPSLASIFRIGKNRSVVPSVNPEHGPLEADSHAQSSGMEEDSDSMEEDWDRMDSASDLDAVSKLAGAVVIDGSATVRGECQHERRRIKRKLLYGQPDSSDLPLVPDSNNNTPLTTHNPILTKRSFCASQTSISIRASEPPFSPSRPIRLSNVEEHETDVALGNVSGQATATMRSASQSYGSKTGSVRSMPPHLLIGDMSSSCSPLPLPVSVVAMTPENIKPLLVNARKVQARLSDCIAEIQTLLKQECQTR